MVLLPFEGGMEQQIAKEVKFFNTTEVVTSFFPFHKRGFL